jgi:hypothetical protein
MKNLHLFLMGLTLIVSQSLTAQSKYEKTMASTLAILDTATKSTTYQSVANTMERVGDAEKDKWLPYYYAGFCYVLMSYHTRDGEEIDALLDKAEKFKEKAASIAKNESEITTLDAWINMARISVDPMNRGQKYSMTAGTLLGKAMQQNPANPRPHYLKGNNTYYTPPMFGGGAKNALPSFEKAAELYETFEAPGDFWPDWGKGNVTTMIEKCKAELGK